MNMKEALAEAQDEIIKLQKRVHSLEAKIGNTNVAASLDSDAQRISQLEDWVREHERA